MTAFVDDFAFDSHNGQSYRQTTLQIDCRETHLRINAFGAFDEEIF